MSAPVNYGSPAIVAEDLTRWEQEHPVVGDPGDAPNIWDEFIPTLDGYNEYATMAADPTERGDILVVNFSREQVTFLFDDKTAEWSF